MIGMVGTNHKRATLSQREAICTALCEVDERCKGLLPCILLQTCNRVEWYFFTQSPTAVHELVLAALRDEVGQSGLCSLYTFFGEECASHLVQVASGMDSFFLGETEIQAQVKNAYLSALKDRTLCKEMHALFQKALHKAKILRSKEVPRREKTLTESVVRCILSCVPQQNDPKILFVGTSMINKLIATAMVPYKIPLAVINRTDERGAVFARKIGAESLPWEMLEDLWCDYSCVVAATKANTCLLKDSECIEPKRQVLIDLAIPRNIDAGLSVKDRMVFNIDSFVPTT